MDDDDKAGYLLDMCKAWIEKYEVTCGETLWQVDGMEIRAIELAKDICDLIGYAKVDDEDIYDIIPSDVEPKYD